jgi:hypothetical protein
MVQNDFWYRPIKYQEHRVDLNGKPLRVGSKVHILPQMEGVYGMEDVVGKIIAYDKTSDPNHPMHVVQWPDGTTKRIPDKDMQVATRDKLA